MAVQNDSLSPMKATAELRAHLDAFAARHAAQRIKAGNDPESLLKQFEHMQSAAKKQDYPQFFEADLQLHLAIVELAQVDGLDVIWQQVEKRFKEFHIETLRKCWPDLNVLCEGHRALVDAIADGDAQTAEDAASCHLDAVWYRIAEQARDASLTDDPLSRVSAYLALHMDQPIQISHLAQDVARISEGHLARLFREHFGQSITEYLRELRMQKARERLVNTKHPINRLAKSVGYADPSRFSQHFLRRFNMTPSDYRTRFSDTRDTH